MFITGESNKTVIWNLCWNPFFAVGISSTYNKKCVSRERFRVNGS